MAEAQPIIVKKKSGGHGGHHGGAWKVAYADFVTAMMALFIALWLMHASPEIQKAVGGYFQDPNGLANRTGTDVAGSGQGITITKDDMKDLKEKLEQSIQRAPDFQKLKDHVQMAVTSEGLRIELLETDKGMFFESGQALPTTAGKELIEKLGKELAALKNKIFVEGHTDSKQYGKSDYSNWELSVDRANAARRILQTSGLQPDRISQVRGFADQRLRVPGNPEDPSNRRISIIVEYPHEAGPAPGEANGAEEKTQKAAASGAAAAKH